MYSVDFNCICVVFIVSTVREEVIVIVISLILVLCSGLTHSIWNMFAKQSTDKSVFLWVIYAPSTIILLPFLITELNSTSLSAQEWLLLIASMIMQSIYAALLSHTYNVGDLSQVYPIMRGAPTLLTPILGVLLLGETMPLLGWFGIVFMLAGFFVMLGPIKQTISNKAAIKPIFLALTVGLCITTYTIIDKANLSSITPLALLVITNIGFLLGLTPAALNRKRLKQALIDNKKIIWLGAILSPGSYFLFLLAAQHTAVSMVAPMREVGIVFGTLLGFFVLKESQGLRRIAASIAVVIGIIVIAGASV
ncbi:DMT family transporter [Paenibacillus yanchengensis]|uniref:DMT family transporter n=1 Tax=Paenibacillus yanchengensis TaxID=2035833 RepID=A0ABW4YP43_9BACL